MRAPESWITPELEWKRESGVFACAVPEHDDGLVRLLAEDHSSFKVLSKQHASLIARVEEGIIGACGVLVSMLRPKPEEDESITLFLHDVFKLPDKKLLVVVGVAPSINVSSARHVLRREKAANQVKEYERKVAVDRQRFEELRTSIRNNSDLSEVNKGKHLHAIDLSEGLHAQPAPPRLRDLEIHTEEIAFANALPRSPRMRQAAVLDAVRSTGRGPSRSGRYECTEILTEKLKVGAIIRWEPRGMTTPALELKAALERRLKSAFSKPRSGSRHPPDTQPPDDPETISRVEIPENPEGLDQQSVSDLLPRPSPQGRDIFKANGFEAIAWYQSFHRYDETAWGIYFNAPMVDLVVASLAQDLTKSAWRVQELAARLVVQLVMAHELFHARVDFAAAWIELASRRRAYLPYCEGVYTSHRFTDEWREESLANWSPDRWLEKNLSLLQTGRLIRDAEAVVRVVRDWLDFSPAGYREWRQGNDPITWARLSSELVTGKPHPNAGRRIPLPIESLLRGDDLIDLRRDDIPIYSIGRGVIADALFSAPSRREVLRILKHFGYQLLPGRGKGSHEVWQGPDQRAFAVPQRDPLSVGVFHELLRHFGWTKQQYMREIRALV